MNKNFLKKYFSVAWSKLPAFRQTKINIESEELKVNIESEELEDEQSPVYKTDSNSQQYIHPYLIDRVEPSVQHIIFSSYIKF